MKRAIVGGAICVITLLNYFHFPGHTWLQQDTQIYVPILEHLWDPSALQQEILVQRPHVAYTLYDETAIALRKITGLDFKQVLEDEQIVTRGLGIWGLYLMVTATGLAEAPALLATAILSLGATILGPAVLTFEYEPNPRGFAVMLLFLAIGLAAHSRYLGAGIAGAAAFLMHPPTVYPVWGVYFCLALWPSKPDVMRRRLYAFIPLFVSTIVLFIASRLQPGVNEAQAFFTRLDPTMEKLQRMRANYCWVDVWWRIWLPHFLFLYAVTLVGYWRLRKRCTVDLRFFLLGLPLIGMLSMPLSYVLLEKMKWALIPQFQPMRALLFVTLLAVFCGAVAGMFAAQQRRWPEAFCWLALAYLVPTNIKVLAVPSGNRIATVVLLTAFACLAVWLHDRFGRPAAGALAACALAGFLWIPSLGAVENYPDLHNPELHELARWARTSTPKNAVFLFPDAGKQLYPGIFRAEAVRAVYVDWKGGGQVNYLKELGEQWWSRWQKAMTKPLTPAGYRQLGIDYLIVRPKDAIPSLQPVYRDADFLAYKLPPEP